MTPNLFPLEIAAIPSLFTFRNDPGAAAGIKKRYAHFRGGPGPRLLFEVYFKKREQSPYKPAISFEGDDVRLKRGDFDCILDRGTGSGRLEIRPGPQSFDSFLRTLYSWELLREGGLLLHCAGLVKKGKAYLFLGRSGAGKSTLSKLAAAAGAEIISDELNLVRSRKGRFVVYGSPFWGEMRNEGRQGAWPLAKVFILDKAKLNRVSDVSSGRSLAVLLRCLMSFSRSRGASAAALSGATRLMAEIPFSRLEFSKSDVGFLDLI